MSSFFNSWKSLLCTLSNLIDIKQFSNFRKIVYLSREKILKHERKQIYKITAQVIAYGY